MIRRLVLVAGLALVPTFALAQSDGTATDQNCTVLAQQAAAGMAATLQADDQTITPPKSVTQLSCLNNFFNGIGLNVVTNLLNPASLLQAVEGQICSAVQSAWNSTIGAQHCGLTLTGFNMGGFDGLGGGNLCPSLSFGGGGVPIGSIGTGAGAGNSTISVQGTGQPPSGYTLPSITSGLY